MDCSDGNLADARTFNNVLENYSYFTEIRILFEFLKCRTYLNMIKNKNQVKIFWNDGFS